MKRSIVVLLLGFLVGTPMGQGPVQTDWMKNIFDSVNQLNANIQGNVQRLNQQIQESVRGHLAQVDRLNSDIAQNIEQMASLRNVSGPTILVNNVGGTSRSIFSGTGPNGEPYYRDSEDRVVGNILHHTERTYNPTTRAMEETRYTLDLKDPKAKRVYV